MRLKIAARKSDLARLQAYRVAEALKKKHPSIEIEFQFKESLGDKNLTDPLWKIPEKGVFTEDFYQDLKTGKCDMVVHSWKDLPTETKPDTLITATLERADQRDLLLIKRSEFDKIKSTEKLRIFSSSPRREYNLTPFLKEALPFSVKQVEFESVRGNIPTRIRKLIETENISGLILAKAALDRLLTAPEPEFSSVQSEIRKNLSFLDWMVLPLSINPNAAAQGALAIEIYHDRKDLAELLNTINDKNCFQAALQERNVLAQYGGGCHQKIGIAVLAKEYGTVQICRGLTDAGQVLQQLEVLRPSEKRFNENQMWAGNSESLFERHQLPFSGLATSTNAIFVAKSHAWPKNFKFKGIVWTSGLNTWKTLAKMGIWVHGTQDGFGEAEHQMGEDSVKALVNSSLNWVKFTHEGGVEQKDKQSVATYRLVPKNAKSQFAGKEAFYWSSGSQFLQAITLEPGLIDRNHACGPGHTYHFIEDQLRKLRPEKVAHVEVFLNASEWKQKCQK